MRMKNEKTMLFPLVMQSEIENAAALLPFGKIVSTECTFCVQFSPVKESKVIAV